MARQRTLTRDDFVTAAFAYIDAHGAAALTATTLGEVMGVHQTAIYRHLPSMEDLHGAVIDRLLGQLLELPIPDGTARERLHSHAMNVHRTFYAHPNVMVLLLSSRGDLPNSDKVSLQGLTLLRDLGLSGRPLAICHQLLESFIAGTHLFDLAGAPHHLEIRRQRRRRIDDPDLDAATPTVASVGELNSEAFVIGLDVLIDFCERQAASQR